MNGSICRREDHALVERVERGATEGINTFESAVVTDRLIERMIEDSKRGPRVLISDEVIKEPVQRSLPAQVRNVVRSGIKRFRALLPGRK